MLRREAGTVRGQLGGDAVIDEVLDELDTAVARERLVRAVIESVAVRAGVARTPGGLLLAA